MNALSVALLQPIVETAVNFVQNKYPSLDGPNKRINAWKYVKDRVNTIETLIGSLNVPMDDSVIFGLIDGVVADFNHSGQFEKTSDVRHYKIKRAESAFQFQNPETGVSSWMKLDKDGKMVPAPMVVDRATGQMIPEPDKPEFVVQPAAGAPAEVPPAKVRKPRRRK